jgi:hypothetical protein
MTDVETLDQINVAEGDHVRLIQQGNHLRVNTNDRVILTPDIRMRVTRVYSDTVMVRTVSDVQVRGQYGGSEMRLASFTIPKQLLVLWDSTAPRPRKLGQKPEDTEEQTFIDVNDPRVKWIWDDLGAYAEGKNWCSEYDQLCARVGIPGRPRDFSVEYRIGDIPIRATVKAHSQREANELVRSALEKHVADAAAATPEPTSDFALAG